MNESAEWLYNLNKVKDFVVIYKRVPNIYSLDPDESRIGRWFIDQKDNIDTLPESRKIKIDNLINSNHYKYAKKPKDRKTVGIKKEGEELCYCYKKTVKEEKPLTFKKSFLINCNNIKKFISKNNRYPKRTSTHILERKLASFIMNNKKKYINNNLDQKRIKILEALPKWSWRDVNNNHKLWLNSYLRCYKEFKKNISNGLENNRKTLSIATYSWYICYRTFYRKNNLCGYKIRLLDAIPGWRW